MATGPVFADMLAEMGLTPDDIIIALTEVTYLLHSAKVEGDILEFNILEVPNLPDTALMGALMFDHAIEDALLMRDASQYGARVVGSYCEMDPLFDEKDELIAYCIGGSRTRHGAAMITGFTVRLPKGASVDDLSVEIAVGVKTEAGSEFSEFQKVLVRISH